MNPTEPNDAQDVAALSDVLPVPRFSIREWQEFARRGVGEDKVNGAVEVWHTPLSAQSWLAWGSYGSEELALTAVYPFPTATDCLFWYRWCVLGIVSEIESRGEYDKELFLLADDMRAVTDTASQADTALLLRDMEEDALYHYDGFTLHSWESVHDYLTRQGSVEQWRTRLSDPSLGHRESEWQLSSNGWSALREWLRGDIPDA